MGHYLASPNKEKVSEEGEYKNMKYAASSMQGWRVNMEDAHIARFNIAPETNLFGVFDGHGGPEVAKFVAKHLEAELLKNPSFQSGNYGKALTDTFHNLDIILKTPEGKKELASIQTGRSGFDAGDSYAGCTAIVALMVKDKIYVANAGDSRCVIATKGDVVPLSEDHKPDNKEEKDRIEKAGGEVYEGRINGRLNLSRAIGDFDYKGNDKMDFNQQLVISTPDIRTWDMSADDEYLILGCDGIWECLQAKQISEFLSTKIKNGRSIKSAVEDLLDYIVAPDTQSNSGIGLDNMTCICLALK